LPEILEGALGKIPLDDPAMRVALVGVVRTYLPEFLAAGEEAIEALRRRPSETALLLSCAAQAFWEAGLRDRALRLNEKARLLSPGEADLCLQRALFHLDSGDKAQAARWLRATLALKPDQREARFYLNKLQTGREVLE
jgi:tetratricopeptide (TPR) repeat protein